MAKIRIVILKESKEMPDWVKKEFDGLEFFTEEMPENQKPLYVHNFQGDSEGEETPNSDYYVEFAAIVKALKGKNQQAADWLLENTRKKSNLHTEQCRYWVGFEESECVLLDE